MKCPVLIPSYCPENGIIEIAQGLRKSGCRKIVIVDDGSGEKYRPVFETLEKDGCVVLRHDENRGKGAALKTGIAYISGKDPDAGYIVTADGDGQHRVRDILRIVGAAEEADAADPETAPLILGIRDLKQKNVPRRSRFGNWFSSLYFRFSTGKACPDTQTGLRAIPRRFFGTALETEGNRYDFEMNYLLTCAEMPEGLLYVPIETVYESGNHISHFRAVTDSCRIYKTLIRYAAVSLSSAAIDLLLFTVFSFAASRTVRSILFATVCARIMSGIYNFTMNRLWSFSARGSREGSAAGQFVRYAVLFTVQMGVSGMLVTVFSFLPASLVVIKIVCDTLLAIVSYLIQQNWVFRRRTPGGREDDASGSRTGFYSCNTDQS